MNAMQELGKQPTLVNAMTSACWADAAIPAKSRLLLLFKNHFQQHTHPPSSQIKSHSSKDEHIKKYYGLS